MRKAKFKTQLWAYRHKPTKPSQLPGWRLVQPLIYWSEIRGRIEVPAGFQTDFASVPRLPFCYLFFGDRVHAAAVIHDYLCVHHYATCRVSWQICAAVFAEAMKAEDVPLWQRLPMAAAVRLFGLTRYRKC